jgi:large subunit ribosomal protein L3
MSDAAAIAEKPSVSLKSILGRMLGMTQIFDAQGNVIPVSVIQAGPCHITQIMTPQKHGYSAVQVAFGDIREKSVKKPEAGIFKKANVPAGKWFREFRLVDSSIFQVGQAFRVDAFVPGDFVDVKGISKGKGFAGVVKRHNFGGGPSTHGQSDRQRAPGSSGSNTYPGRVFKGKKFPGHLGHETVTVQHLEVVKVDAEKNLLLVRGAVPGGQDSPLIIEQTIKRIKFKAAHVPEVGKKDKGGKGAPAKAAAPKAKGK